MFKTPILFLIFNRPDTTIQVFEAIRQVKPAYLYVAADGPRKNKPGELEKCQETRNIILNGIDWDCEVKTLFRDENLGCGKAVSSAITWFFENVEMGIILEDDCLPNHSFFYFCENLLKKYRENENIFMIGANNFQNKPRGNASYYFSIYGHIWGWATWKRAWNKYRFNLNDVDEQTFKSSITKHFSTNSEIKYWLHIFRTMKHSPIDTWDYQWSFTQWLHGGINIVPQHNLVSNIGFNDSATHTKNFIEGISSRASFGIDQIKHPQEIVINRKADIHTFRRLFKPTLCRRIVNKFKKLAAVILQH